MVLQEPFDHQRFAQAVYQRALGNHLAALARLACAEQRRPQHRQQVELPIQKALRGFTMFRECRIERRNGAQAFGQMHLATDAKMAVVVGLNRHFRQLRERANFVHERERCVAGQTIVRGRIQQVAELTSVLAVQLPAAQGDLE